MKTLQLAPVLIGLFSMGLAAYLALFFGKSVNELGKALRWVLIGETVGSSLITFSATASLFGWWGKHIPQEVTASIRIVGLLIVIGTSIHMYRVIQRLTNDAGD